MANLEELLHQPMLRLPSITILFFCSLTTAVTAQVDTSRADYALLYDGTYIPGKRIGIGRAGFGTPLLVSVDDRRIPARTVRGVHSESHYYANIGHLALSGNPKFIRRAFHGPLDLYEREVINMYMAAPLFFAYPSKLRYYSKGGGPVKQMTRRRLMKDLVDNPKSMQQLRVGRTLTLIGVGMLVGGVSAIIVGNGKFDDTQLDATIPISIPIGSISATLCLVPFLIAPSRSRKAVRTYTGRRL